MQSNNLTNSKSLSKFPLLLHPLVSTIVDSSLQLLLEVAGARSTWLALRYISSALERDDASVVLVSGFYGLHFWKQELRRATGINCDDLIQAGRLCILDSEDETEWHPSHKKSLIVENWKTRIAVATASLKSQGDILLMIDSPDLLLGLETVSASSLLAIIMELRLLARNTVILTSSDIFPPASDGILASALLIQQQQFLVSLIHQADYVLSSRTLDTGQASDVSGVLRVTSGGHVSATECAQAVDKEFLYHVDAGRSAHVWQRGADR